MMVSRLVRTPSHHEWQKNTWASEGSVGDGVGGRNGGGLDDLAISSDQLDVAEIKPIDTQVERVHFEREDSARARNWRRWIELRDCIPDDAFIIVRFSSDNDVGRKDISAGKDLNAIPRRISIDDLDLSGIEGRPDVEAIEMVYVADPNFDRNLILHQNIT